MALTRLCGCEGRMHALIQRRGGGRARIPSINHKAIGSLSNTGPNPLKNDRCTKPVLNFGPSSAHQRNTVRYRADDGPFLVVFGPSLPNSTKKHQKLKKSSELDPLLQNFPDPRMGWYVPPFILASRFLTLRPVSDSNKAQWLAACGHTSASSQSLRFISSLRMNSSFITLRPVLQKQGLSRLGSSKTSLIKEK